MGYAKEHQLEVEDRGYDYIGDRAVCADCLEDADLKKFVDDRRSENSCSYCGANEARPTAIPVDDLLDEIADAVFQDYRALEGSEFFEGEQMVTSHGTEDLFLFEIGWPFANDELGGDVVNAFEITEWVELNPLRLRPSEALEAGWEEFSRQVRTVTRYLFFQEHEGYEDWVDPRRMLQEIHKLVDDFGRVIPMDQGTALFRARPSPLDEIYRSVEDLGPPSPEKAKRSSRMSPAGIPVFYGALDLDTALAETLAHATTGQESPAIRVWWGTFKLLESMRVLDLTSLPPVPGFFSTERRNREALSFLKRFAEEIARPIPQDGREHIEYVPTQVVSEYFRHAYASSGGSGIDGILYPSSVRERGTSCVLFLGADSCCALEAWDGSDGCRLGLDESTVGSAPFRIRWERDTDSFN